MSSILQTLKRAGNIALWHDYRAGHARDFSGNGNHGTLSATDARLDANGFKNSYYGAGYISVTHAASINLQTFSVVMLVTGKRITQSNTAARLFAKGPAGSRAFDISENVPSTAFSHTNDGGTPTTWFPTRSAQGAECFGFNLQTGVVTPMYIDGIFNVNCAPAPTVGTNSNDLYIGNLQGLSRGYGRTISAFLMFNKQLSADEHRQVYLELLK